METHTLTLPEKALIEADTWLDTEFRHGAAEKGLGADCTRFIERVLTAIGYPLVETSTNPPAYGTNEADGPEILLAHLWANLDEVSVADMWPADIQLWQAPKTSGPQHLAMVVNRNKVIHANQSNCPPPGRVCYSSMGVMHVAMVQLHSAWRMRNG